MWVAISHCLTTWQSIGLYPAYERAKCSDYKQEAAVLSSYDCLSAIQIPLSPYLHGISGSIYNIPVIFHNNQKIQSYVRIMTHFQRVKSSVKFETLFSHPIQSSFSLP